MVVNQPLVTHDMGGQDVDDLIKLDGTVDHRSAPSYHLEATYNSRQASTRLHKFPSGHSLQEETPPSIP